MSDRATHGLRMPHLPEESWRLFLDDALPAASEARLESHLDSCAACRERLEALDPTRALRVLRGAVAPPGTWDGFDAALSRALDEDESASSDDATADDGKASIAGERRGALLRWAAVAAGVMLTAIVVGTQLPADEAAVIRASGPCPEATTTVALSRDLSRDECAALYGSGLDLRGPDEILVRRDLDLRGL